MSDAPPNADALLVSTGPDRPGILDELSHYAADRGACVKGLRVASLGGWCAVIAQVVGDAPSVERLEADLSILSERTGLRAWVEHVAGAGVGDGRESRRFALVARGGHSANAAGESQALRQASNLFRVLNVNIQDVTAAVTGHGEATEDVPPFEMRMMIDVPRDVPVAKLRELLGQLFDGLGAGWELHAVTNPAAE